MTEEGVSRRGIIGGLIGTVAAAHGSAATSTGFDRDAKLKLFRATEFGGVARAISAGEAATSTGAVFLVDDGAGTLEFRERSVSGSGDVPRSVPVAALAQPLASGDFSYDTAPYVRARPALEKLREIGASAKDGGAAGDFTTDDTEALQEIANHFGARGGKWFLPPGIYRTTRPITIPCSLPQAISGQGQRGVYPGAFDPAEETHLAVIVPVHSGRHAFRFTGSAAGHGSVSIRDLAITTLGDGQGPEACFAWDTTDEVFLRNFNFLFTSINGFTSAFDVHQSSGGMKQVGLFRAMFCNIHHNRWIARTLNGTQWNGFEFSYNEAGQNGFLPGQGGIDIAGHAVNIVGNCLEGMRDPIRISGAYRGIEVRGNYFEGNVGKALIHLAGVRGPFEIGAQAHTPVEFDRLEHHVLLTACGHGTCLMPYRPDGVHKMTAQTIGNAAGGDLSNSPLTGTATDGWLRCDSLSGNPNLLTPPHHSAMATSPVEVVAREISPLDGGPMPVAELRLSEGREIRATYSLKAEAGAWAVMSFLMKRMTEIGLEADPRLSLHARGNGATEGREYTLHNFSQWWRAEEWCLITAAIKLTSNASQLTTVIYPFGKNAAPNARARFLNPLVYVTDSVDRVTPFVSPWFARSVSSAPTAGTWQLGDILNNANPTARGQGQFICLESGTPGRWSYT